MHVLQQQSAIGALYRTALVIVQARINATQRHYMTVRLTLKKNANSARYILGAGCTNANFK